MRGATSLNLLEIGAVLSLFGTGGIAGSRLSAYAARFSIGTVCITAGILGGVSIFYLSFATLAWGFAVALFFWGVAFLTIHTNYIGTAQSLMPEYRGTVMSLMSFCWLSGGTAGTLINKQVIEACGISAIYVYTSVLFGVFAVSAALVLNMISRIAPQAGKDENLACEPAA